MSIKARRAVAIATDPKAMTAQLGCRKLVRNIFDSLRGRTRPRNEGAVAVLHLGSGCRPAPTYDSLLKQILALPENPAGAELEAAGIGCEEHQVNGLLKE